MDAAAQPTTPPGPAGDPGAAPKLAIDRFADGGVVGLRFAGAIDEAFDGKKLATTVKADTLVLDLGGVKKISSFGIREWVDFIGAVARQAPRIVLVECSPKVVDQLNMVANFAGGGRVYSFYAPFRCDYCDSEHRVRLTVDKDAEAIKAMKLAERPCPACKEGMYFDEDGATFFSYLAGQERFELDPEVEAFLASKLDYAVADGARKLRVDKIIEGRATYVRLAGDLDGAFPREKLAEGLEGVVVLDVAGIGRIEPAGAAEWRGFLQLVSPGAEKVCLVGVPPPFLEKLGGREDLGAKAQIVSFTLPYACKACGTTGGQLLEVDDHHEVLKFATAPELRCAQCKAPMACAASEALMASLPGLARPGLSPDLRKLIKELRERKLEKKKPAAAPAAVGATAAPSGGAWWVPFAAAVLAVALAGGGFLAYQAFTSRPRPAGLGAVTSRSAPQRPAWAATASPGAAACTDAPDKGLACVGASAVAATQDEAEEEALDAALDALAVGVAGRIAEPRWRQAVAPIFKATRDAKLGALARDPASTQARRDVREARRAVAALVRATSGGAVPPTPAGRYWEGYDTADGKRFVAFAEVEVGAAGVAGMVERYTRPTTALGATVVELFPLLAWRHPRVEGGAVVIGLDKGPLKDLGLAEQYLVLAVAGRDAADAAAFAKLATEERARLEERGGTFALKVQAGDGAPREFSAVVPGRAVEPAAPVRPAGGPGERPAPGTGTFNVWDKANGTKGAGRDDPNQ